MERVVIWDDRNTHHLLVERAHRGITQDQVEDVLLGEDTAVVQHRTGYDFYIGTVADGRFLGVIAMGEHEVYPLTAYWVEEARWRKASEKSRR